MYNKSHAKGWESKGEHQNNMMKNLNERPSYCYMDIEDGLMIIIIMKTL